MDGGDRHTRDWDPGNPNTPRPESSSRRRRRRLPLAPTTDVDYFTSSALSGAGADPSVDSSFLEEWTSRRRDVALGLARARELAPRRRPSSTRWQASSSAAPPSDHSGTEGAVTRTRMRQSVMYANRPRRPRRRQEPVPTQDHPSEVDSSELGGTVTDLPPLEALSLSDPQPSTRRQASSSAAPPVDPPRAIEHVTRTRVRQSVLYSNRPRRRRHRQVPAPTTEHPNEVSSSELGMAVTDLPRLEALSLSEPPVLTPETDEESDYGDYDDMSHEPIEFGIGTFGPETLCYSPPPPQPEWLGGVRGETTLEELAADPSYPEPDPSRSEALSANDSDYDTEEELRLLDEYLAANTCTSFREGFDKILAVQHDKLTKLAAEMGVEPPPPREPKRFPVDRGTLSVQERQQPSSAATTRKPRCEASNAELVENAENWMREEVKMLFEKYIERRDDLKELDCCFNELCHQCFNVEHYNKIFHHYNFTVKMKKPDSDDCVTALYFAEVKQIFGRKYYFCCRLEPNENGNCYACKSQGVEDLQHPTTGGYDRGSSNIGFGLWYE